MSRFNWWRRTKKNKPLAKSQMLKGQSALLQQIKHGDFELSDYGHQAKQELVNCELAKQKIRQGWVASEDSLRHKLEQLDRSYQKRYNRLYKDHDAEEARLLAKLRQKLYSEFRVDVWDLTLQHPVEMTTEQFYHKYKQYAAEASLKLNQSTSK